jgi:hypothetical protein
LHDDASDSDFEFSYNRMTRIHGTAVFLIQGGQSQKPSIPKASKFTYQNNDIKVVGNGNGFILIDIDNLGNLDFYPSTGSRVKAVVKNNNLSNLNVPLDMGGGIQLEGLDDPQIINNKITGSGGLAIIAGTWGPTRRGLIQDNNLSGFKPSNGSPYKILLDWGTQNYRVTGVPVEAVDDNGTNNLIGDKKGSPKENHSPETHTEKRNNWMR